LRIIVPGKKSDHILTRSSSRRLFSESLNTGAKIYEYQPGMIHVKVLIVDAALVVDWIHELWRKRPLLEHLTEAVGWMLQRQQ